MSAFTFTHRNRNYDIPQIYVPNSLKFELIRDIIFKYNYVDFICHFDDIYNNLDIQTRHICYWIHFIGKEYTRLKMDNDRIPGFGFGDIIANMQNDTISVFGRKNSKHFHADFIPIICCWIRYKNIHNQWTTNDGSYEITQQLKGHDRYLTLNGKIQRFLSHFDY